MTKLDWENITNYIDSVGTTDTVFPFAKVQSSVKVTASGARDNIIYTIGGQSGTLLPGQSVTVTGSISSMTLRSASGRQPFQVWAVEAGTEKDETDTSYQGQIDGLTTSLAENASQLTQIAVNVKNPPVPMVGAKGDGVTDDTNAIQNILNYLNGITDVSKLFFPNGVYLISSKLSVNRPGLTIEGVGCGFIDEATTESRIKASNSFSGTSLIEFKHATANYLRSPSIKNIHLDGGSSSVCDGLVMYDPYDHAILERVQVDNIDGSKSCFKFLTSDPSAIGQTVTGINLFGYPRVGSTKSAPVFYAENLQECVFINSKMCSDSVLSPEAWHFKDCAGITLLTPSAVATKAFVIERYKGGDDKGNIHIINPTIENCTTVLDTINTQTALWGTFTGVNVGDTVKQGANTGVVYVVGASGIYVTSVVGTFTNGTLYKADGVTSVGTITSISSKVMYGLKLDNPRLLSPNQNTYVINLNQCNEANIDLSFPVSGGSASTYTVNIDSKSSNNRVTMPNNNYTINDSGQFNDIKIIGFPKDIYRSTNGSDTYNLPSARKGLKITLHADNNYLLVKPNGTDTINGTAGQLTMQKGEIELTCVNAGAWTISRNTSVSNIGTTYFDTYTTSIAASSSQNVAASMTGGIYTNTGASAAITLTLPTSNKGMLYKFFRSNASNALTINPQATEAIAGTTGAGKGITLGSAYAAVTLVCTDLGYWYVINSTGTVTYS